MNAVDAAQRPEVEEDDLPLQVLVDRQRAGRVEPGDAAVEVRGGLPVVGRLGVVVKGGLKARSLRPGGGVAPGPEEGDAQPGEGEQGDGTATFIPPARNWG